MAKINISNFVALCEFILSLSGNSHRIGYVTWESEGKRNFNVFPTGGSGKGSRSKDKRNPYHGRVTVIKRWQFWLSPYVAEPTPPGEEKRESAYRRQSDFCTKLKSNDALYLLVDPASRVESAETVMIDGRPATEGEEAVLAVYKKPPKGGGMEALSIPLVEIVKFSAEGGHYIR